MLDKMTDSLAFQGRALVLRAERQRTLASNIANVDTPGYVARDFKFADAMKDAQGSPGSPTRQRLDPVATDTRHLPLASQTGSLGGSGPEMGYSVQAQPNLDNNTVDLDRERANFVDNSIRYEATLRFINGQAKTILSAIQGQ